MNQTLPPTTFEEFIAWYPENSGKRYELHRGTIVEIDKPTGNHSKIAGAAVKQLNDVIDANQYPYFIPKECIIRSLDGSSGYEPDVVVVDEAELINEPLWESGSILTRGKSIKLVVEIVSTKQTDESCLNKLSDYKALGIPEYCILDYSTESQPSMTVYSLVGGEYIANSFSELALTTLLKR